MTGGSRLRYRCWLAALAAVAALGILPAGASAAKPQKNHPSIENPSPASPDFNDRVVRNPNRKLRRVIARAAFSSEGRYTTPSGARVAVFSSDAYAPDPAGDQQFANLYDSFLHGFELERATIYIAPPPEVAELCGEGAAACYIPPGGAGPFGNFGSDGLLITNGNSDNIEADAAHEYGHHIAAYRDNAPLSAFDTGAKYWASYLGVCPSLRTGRMGFGAENYLVDPAEGWSEAYAETTLPGVGWADIVSRELFFPDATTSRIIRDDVLNPWSGYETKRFRGRLRRGGARKKGRKVATTLDGIVRVYLRPQRGREFDLFLKVGGRIVKKSVTRGGDKLRYQVCGPASVKVVVKRRRGSRGGRFRVRVLRP